MRTIDVPREPPAAPLDAAARRRLLDWYDRHRRDLPWRARPGERPHPYRVWLSEIMLQQTTVATVRGYFGLFVARWPRVEDMAAADLDAILVAWQGLGYYARARNLHACARVVTERHGGRFPDAEHALRQLPGIGDYTAAAIAAIAFGRPTVPVDGNVLRVLARIHAVGTPLPTARTVIGAYARTLASDERPGDFAQALMDLGAAVCTPRAPRCLACPWSHDCRGLRQGRPEAFPVAARRIARPTRHGAAFWALRDDGAVLFRRRPPNGLLGGMMEVPSTAWRSDPWPFEDAIPFAPAVAEWRPVPGRVVHAFTHFRLELTVLTARVTATTADGDWHLPDRLDHLALPTLIKKVVRHVSSAGAVDG
ncbi:MAG: A/G-specific adenine glycosylase [Rhodospirillales bacterium]|nr:A/G-specific adenine glycosylase [Rhodospirillales bacterium]